MQPLPSWSLEMQKNFRLFIFWETTQHFLNLKTCFDRNFCHLQFKLQSIKLNIIIVWAKMLINYKSERKHDNVKYYKESFKLTW